MPADAVVLSRVAPVRLGPLTIEPALRRVVHNDGQETFLQPRVMQVLVALLRAEGQILSRDDLMAQCWSGMVVGEDALNRVMARLRRLSEGLGAGAFKVETTPRVGYRLIAETSTAPAAVPDVTAQAEPVLAVLAFDNLSGGPEMDYFSDGVSEEILQTVGRGADLKVIGRSSSFHFRGAEKAAARVAAALKATHVLDGSVRRSGSKVRIVANLIECAHETLVWSDRYERDLTDIFALQDEIAASVAAALRTAFARSPPARIDPAAYDLFLRAQGYLVWGALADTTDQHLGEGGFEGWSRRSTMIEEVVARAPTFARGWAALATCRAYMLRQYRDEAAAAGLTRDLAVAAAETALRLAPHTALAYQALGSLEPQSAYRAREALHDKALALAPDDATVLASTAAFCGIVGRGHESLALARRAYDVDPLERGVIFAVGLHLVLAGLKDEAARMFDAGRNRWPEDPGFAASAIVLAAHRGDREEFERLVSAWAPAADGNASLQDQIWFARNLIEPDIRAIRGYLAKQRAQLGRTGTVALYAPLSIYRLGLTDEAFEMIDRASFTYMFDPETASPTETAYPGAIFSRAFDGALFQDPRFPRLCAKLGLCDYWIETGKWPDCADEAPYDFRAEVRKLAGAHRPTA